MSTLDSASANQELLVLDVINVYLTTGAILPKAAVHVTVTSTDRYHPSATSTLVTVNVETASWECDVISARRTTSTTARITNAPNALLVMILSRIT